MLWTVKLFLLVIITTTYQQTNGCNSSDYKTNEEENYDFIIVGSGTAGSVVANRLSEIHKWKILLLEAGEEPNFLTNVPALSAIFQFTNYNWGYLMERQENFGLGLDDEMVSCPRGKVLGGSSILNYMIHVRGNKHDYDRWASLGNPRWSYKEVLPYFLKSEDSHVYIQDDKYRGRGGYLNVQDVNFHTDSVHAFIKAAQEVGYKYVDYNGKTQLGVSYIQVTQRKGQRCSAEKAFLRPARSRPNLTILTKAHLTKVLVDPTSKTAYGVQYIKDSSYHIARASKEIILSAGTFGSPQILMLSGIGPKQHLKELGIPVINDLPVGQKLYDHLTFVGLVFTVNESIVITNEMLVKPINYMELFFRGHGPLSSSGGVEAIAFLKTNVSNYPENYPDVELIFLSAGVHTDKGQFYKKMFRINDKVYDAIWKPLENKFALSILPLLLHPKSYGHVKLKSKNPYHWPKLYGNYLTDPQRQDVKILIAGIREAEKISKAPDFQKYGSQIVKIPIPGCEQHVFDTDDYWECGLRHISSTLHHQTSTCKMGPREDPEAIVDSRLKVYGIQNLRVIDASIVPIPLSAHMNIPTYMVGEKGSDIIKEDWLNT